jgi:DNA-binding CsgD family transcriptional regulator
LSAGGPRGPEPPAVLRRAAEGVPPTVSGHAAARAVTARPARWADGRDPGEAGLWRELAQAEYHRGDLGAALDAAVRGREHARSADDPAGAAAASGVAACCLAGMGRVAEALAEVTAAARVVDALTDGALATEVVDLVWLPRAENALERFRDALRHTDRCLAIARATGRAAAISDLLTCRSAALAWLGRLQEAAACAEDAVDAARPMRAPAPLLAARLHWAAALVLRGDTSAVSSGPAGGPDPARLGVGGADGGAAGPAVRDEPLGDGANGPGCPILLGAPDEVGVGASDPWPPSHPLLGPIAAFVDEAVRFAAGDRADGLHRTPSAPSDGGAAPAAPSLRACAAALRTASALRSDDHRAAIGHAESAVRAAADLLPCSTGFAWLARALVASATPPGPPPAGPTPPTSVTASATRVDAPVPPESRPAVDPPPDARHPVAAMGTAAANRAEPPTIRTAPPQHPASRPQTCGASPDTPALPRVHGLPFPHTADVPAVEAAGRALAAFERGGAVVAMGVARMVCARAHEVRGDRAAALAELEAAARTFTSCGAERLLLDVLRRQRRLGRRVSRAAPGTRRRPDRSAVLTPREAEVAGLAALGRTNRAIAKALVISEHTVETHLSRVYAKLGVPSRAALAARLYGPHS